mmetsp:Transcript_8169/g.25163  ORF Transcript_8169/g.25163 Transcript_8169/m.25163 type:complete len:471 (-) Transcript_8169:750-2162(-)
MLVPRSRLRRALLRMSGIHTVLPSVVQPRGVQKVAVSAGPSLCVSSVLKSTLAPAIKVSWPVAVSTRCTLLLDSSHSSSQVPSGDTFRPVGLPIFTPNPSVRVLHVLVATSYCLMRLLLLSPRYTFVPAELTVMERGVSNCAAAPTPSVMPAVESSPLHTPPMVVTQPVAMSTWRTQLFFASVTYSISPGAYASWCGERNCAASPQPSAAPFSPPAIVVTWAVSVSYTRILWFFSSAMKTRRQSGATSRPRVFLNCASSPTPSAKPGWPSTPASVSTRSQRGSSTHGAPATKGDTPSGGSESLGILELLEELPPAGGGAAGVGVGGAGIDGAVVLSMGDGTVGGGGDGSGGRVTMVPKGLFSAGSGPGAGPGAGNGAGCVGDAEGALVGAAVTGAAVGACVGSGVVVGSAVGASVGAGVGLFVGLFVGGSVASGVGFGVGASVAAMVGTSDGGCTTMSSSPPPSSPPPHW